MEVHEIKAGARLRNISTQLDSENGIRLCSAKLHLDQPLIIANYSPNFRDTDNPITNLPRDVIRLVTTTFESTLATSWGTAIATMIDLNGGFSIFQSCPVTRSGLAGDRRVPDSFFGS